MIEFAEKDWYSPPEIFAFFKWYQYVNFIFPNFRELGLGVYPQDSSSYTGTSSRQSKADYEAAIEIHAEVTQRLDMCPDGWMVLYRYEEEYETEYQILSIIRQKDGWQGNNNDLKNYIKDQLSYICGGKRKITDFNRWLQNRDADRRRASQNKAERVCK